MMLRWMGVAAVLGATMLTGCSLMSSAVDQADEDESAEDESGGSGDSYSGKWTREDNGAVFEVSDDGTDVTGKLIDGDKEYLDYFKSYEIALARKGSGLKGKAKIIFKDTPDETVETKWEITRDGDTLKAKLEYIKYDDDGNEDGRGTEDKTFAFEAEGGAPAAAAYTPPAVDMSAYVPVSPTYKHMLYEDMAVGQWGEVEMEVAGQKHMTRTAVVAETDDAWIIEIDNQMNQKDLLIAVFVDKESGETSKAFVGKRGEDGKEKEVPPMPEAVEGEAPEGEDEEVEVEAGTFESKRYESNGTTSWMGTDGDTEGVMLKSKGTNYEEELLEIDADSTYDAGGTEFAAKYLKYKTGGEQWHAKDDKPYFNAMLKMKTSSMSSALVGQGDDAEPAFNYER